MNPSAERYESLGEIARGGMGVVLRVQDRSLDRTLAMKRMLAAPDADSGEVTAAKFGRFFEEAQITAQLDHPAIVPIHELGTDADGATYYTMKLVRGRELGQVCALARQGDGWNVACALGVLVRVCQAVAFAHGKGVVHRDVKPANVMVGDLGEVYVMDWGLAKMAGRADLRDIRLRLAEDGITDLATIAVQRDALHGALDGPLLTKDGAVVGTPAYMAPEQAAGRVAEVDHLSDLYALGALLYELLTGQPPYMPAGQKTTAREVLSKVLTVPPERIRTINAHADAELAAICEKAMAREKSGRYQSAIDLAEDLQAYLDGRVVAAYERGAWAEMRKWVRRNRATAIAGSVALVAAVAGLGATAFVQSRAAERQHALFQNEQRAKSDALHAVADSLATLGLRDGDDGEMSRAALWFTKAAELSTDDPVRERLNRTRAREFGRRALVPVRAWLVPAARFEGVEFSPDGRYLLVRNSPASVTLLNVARDSVRADTFADAAFHPDGMRAAFARGDVIEIHRLADDSVEAAIPLSTGGRALWFSPDGRWLCISGTPTRVWDVAAGRLLEAAFDIGAAVKSASFDETGTRLLLASENGAVLFAIPSGATSGKSVAHDGWSSKLAPAFLPGGRFFTFATAQEFAVWETETGRQISKTNVGPGHTTMSTDGTLLFSAAGITATADGGKSNVPTAPNLSGARVCPDGTVLTGNIEQPLFVDPQTLAVTGRLGRHTGFLSGVAVSLDGTLAATLEGGGLVRVWKLVQPVDHWRAPGQGGTAFSADGHAFVVPDGNVARVFFANGTPACGPLDAGTAVNGAVLSPDGALLLLRCGATVQAWRWRDGARVFTAALPDDSQRMALSPDGARVATCCAEGIILVDTASGAVSMLAPLNARAIAFTDDGRVLAALVGNMLHAFDVPSGAARFPALTIAGVSQGLNIHGRTVAVWRNERMGGDAPCFFDLDTGKPSASALNYRYLGVPWRGEFSEDGALFLFSGLLSGLKVWDWRRGEQTCPDLPHRGWVTASFVSGTPWIVSAGNRPDPGSVRFWDRVTGQPVAPARQIPRADGASLRIAPDGRTALVGDGSGVLHGLDLAGLHDADTLPAADLAQLAELNSGYRILAGGLVMLAPEEFLQSWRDFRTRHPEHHAIAFSERELTRWHDTESRDAARSPAYRAWHRARLK